MDSKSCPPNFSPVTTPIAIYQKGFEGVWELWKVENHWMVVLQRKGHCNTRVLSYWVNILNVMSYKNRSSIFELI
jgi:hypothetical protein